MPIYVNTLKYKAFAIDSKGTPTQKLHIKLTTVFSYLSYNQFNGYSDIKFTFLK